VRDRYFAPARSLFHFGHSATRARPVAKNGRHLRVFTKEQSMRLSTASRLIAGLATVALASTALALPASAAESSTSTVKQFDVDRSVLTDFAATHAAGRYSAADLVAEGDIDDLEALADEVCANPATPNTAPNANLILLNWAESPLGPTVFLFSADVNQDDDITTYEKSCNFALFFTNDGTSMNGSLSMAVTSDIPEGADVSLDPLVTRSGPFNGDNFYVEPVFTTVTEWANVSFSASGNQLTPSQRNVKAKVSTPKTKKQKKAAKKKYDKRVKSAKKAYKKAGKTKKAKRAYKKKIATYKASYKKAIATYKYVTRLQSYTAVAPFTLAATLDGSNS
jgi:hypothetical protein